MHAVLDKASLIVERQAKAPIDEPLYAAEIASRPISCGAGTVPLSLIDAPASSRLAIRLASTDGQRNDASYLVGKMYEWRGYQVEDGARPNCVTLVASKAARVMATITVGFDSSAGLAVSALYPAEVSQLRSAGARLCEFTRLAVDRNEHPKELLAMMFHVAYMCGRRLRECSDLLIEVNPRHVRYYARMLGFRPLAEERVCPRVGAPAVLMWLPLAHAEEQIACHGGRGDSAVGVRSLYPLFFSPDEEEGILRRLQRADHTLAQERSCSKSAPRYLHPSLS